MHRRVLPRAGHQFANCAAESRCKFTMRYTFDEMRHATIRRAHSQAHPRCRLRAVPGARATRASAWTRSRPRPASPSARSTIISRARMRCSPPCSRRSITWRWPPSRHLGTGFRARPRPSSTALFQDLAVWADTPRWAGSGFTRLVIELADLPGHPARLIARRHKAMLKAHLAELLAQGRRRCAARARPRNLAAVRGSDLADAGPRRPQLCRRRSRCCKAPAAPGSIEEEANPSTTQRAADEEQAPQNMLSARRALSSDMRLCSQGGSKVSLTGHLARRPAPRRPHSPPKCGISPATGQPGAVSVISTATLRSSSTSIL